MTREQSNVETLSAVYKAWHDTKGDSEVVYPILADEIAWGSLADGKPGMEFTRPRATKAEVIGYFDGLVKDWSMEFFHVNEMIAQGERVVVLIEMSWTNRHTGKTMTMSKVDIWRMVDGKATEFMEFYDTHKALEAAQA